MKPKKLVSSFLELQRIYYEFYKFQPIVNSAENSSAELTAVRLPIGAVRPLGVTARLPKIIVRPPTCRDVWVLAVRLARGAVGPLKR